MQKSINDLQAKDFAAWLRKQARLFGRKAEIGTMQDCPVEVWIAEVTGQRINFICGGDLIICGKTAYYDQHLFTEFTSSAYYMFDDDARMVTQIGAWLKIIELDDPEAYLIAR